MVDGPAPGAVTSQTLTTPDKPASVKGLADPASVKVFSGQVEYSVPIVMPPGRAGFGPSLSLAYSGDLGSGPLGVGWTLGTFAIKRSLREGVPTYSDADELELIGIGGGGRLYSQDGGKRYWVEGKGRSIKVDRKGRWFEVRDANGVRYVLGMSDNAVQEVDGRRFAWFVEAIVDVTGLQRIDFAYEHDANDVYLKSVTWGPLFGAPGKPAYRLDVTIADRPDKTRSWARGFEVQSRKRVSRLNVTAFDSSLRQYDLSYFPVDSSFRLSRLQAIKVTGFGAPDGAGQTPSLSLPITQFSYVGSTTGQTVQVANLDGWVLNERGTSLVDVDGDGMADLYRMEMGNHVYRKGTGAGFSESRYKVAGSEGVDLESTRLMDLDGDARPELIRIVNDTWRWSKLEPESPGSLNFKWVSQGEWPGTAGVALTGPETVFVDLNGDGRTDVLQAAADALLVRFNTKDGLGPIQRKPLIDPYNVGVDPGNPYLRFEDFNGDGLVDVAWLTDEWMKVWFGKGDGTFLPFDRLNYPWGKGAFSDKEVLFADLDRDGILDLVRITAGYVTWYPGLPAGGFDPQFRMATRPTGASADTVVSIADANGNGSRDIVWSTPSGMWILDLAGNGTAGMMDTIDNGLGATTKFTYSTSALLAVADEAAGHTWTHKLPVAVPVPISTRTIFEDGLTPAREVNFGIRDGVWDGEERRFAGFLYGGRTVAAGTAKDLLHEEMKFLAGLGAERVLRGVQWFALSENGLGEKYTESTSEWAAMPVAYLQEHPWAKKAAKLSETGKSYEGVQTPIETASTFEYDGEVRLIREHHKGRTDMSGDEKEVARTYAADAPDDVTWVRDRVCEQWLYQADGTTVVSHSQTYYGDDSQIENLCVVGRGWIRSEVGLRSPLSSHDPDQGSRTIELSRRTYDQYGNPLTIYQNGVERTLSYESNPVGAYPDGIFPSREAVVPYAGKTLSWTAKWDPRTGLVTEVTDPNAIVTSVEYDALGRQITAATNSPNPHVYYFYDWGKPQPRTWTYVWDKDSSALPARPSGGARPSGDGWRQSVAVANGSGEDLFSATRLTSSRWIISEWKERDNRGHVVRHGDPFYWNGIDPVSANPSAALPANADDEFPFRSQRLDYDALGRLRTQTLPNGATKSVAYKAFEQTVTSSELAPVTSRTDGLGRIIHTERKVAGILERADAAYDQAGRLTRISLQGGKADHEFAYDSLGRLVWAFDPDIGSREMRYDDRNLLVRHRNGAGDVLAFFYDNAARLTARGPRSDFDNPAATYVASEQDYRYTYDIPASEVASVCTARTEGRLAAVDEPGIADPNNPGGGRLAKGRVAFCYDTFGQQNVMSRRIDIGRSSEVTGWESDKFSPSGLVLSQRTDDGFVLQPTYDAAGRLAQLGDIWRAGTSAAADSLTGMDAAGRVLFETYGSGVQQAYHRDKVGLPSGIGVVHPPTGGGQPGVDDILYSVSIERDLYGAPHVVKDLAREARLHQNRPAGPDHYAKYDYDSAARLISATMGEAPERKWHFRFQYDGLQNMTGRTQQGPVATDGPATAIQIHDGTYRYDGTGPRQLTSIVEGCNGTEATFSYDGAGRMRRDSKKTLNYDGYDQLVSVFEDGNSTALIASGYGYDGQRTYTKGRSEAQAQYWFTPAYTRMPDGTRRHFVTVGDRLVAQLTFDGATQPLRPEWVTGFLIGPMRRLDRNAPGYLASLLAFLAVGLLVWSTVVRRRPAWRSVAAVATAYALALLASGCAHSERTTQALSEQPSHRVYFHQGVAAGPTVLSGVSGQVLEDRRFEPFGQQIEAWAPNRSKPFSGVDISRSAYNSLNKETDPNTGWSYHGARWMAPQTARWLTPDPPVKAPDAKFMAQPWGLHPYQYGNQSPTLYWDPDGNRTDSEILGTKAFEGQAEDLDWSQAQLSLTAKIDSWTNDLNALKAQMVADRVAFQWNVMMSDQERRNVISCRSSGSCPGAGPARDVGADRALGILEQASPAMVYFAMAASFGAAQLMEAAVFPVAGFAGSAKAVPEETVDLFRAVGVREYYSVMRTRRFLPGGPSLEGRQFAFTLEEALKYAETDLNKVAILRVTIAKDALKAFDFSKSIDPHIFVNGVVTVQSGLQSAVFHASLRSIVHAF
jgi:RHS repeat-associated protein